MTPAAPDDEAPSKPARPPLQERLMDRAKAHWAWGVVAVLGVFMFWVRMIPYDRFREGDAVYFIGTDPYYHARQVFFSVDNWPRTLQYDPMTQYPLGTDPGQFGTLFDVLGASLAWLVGLVVDGGAPSQDTVLNVFLAYPALLGALTIIPIFLLARELTRSTGAGLVAALVAAFLPGEFLVRSLAAYVDHHVIEALLSTLAVWAVLKAVHAWESTGLTLELVLEDPTGVVDPAHRKALWVSLGAFAAFWAYLAAWPSGVLFVGIVGAWVVLDTVFEQARGRDPSPVILTAVAVFLPLAVVMLFHVERPGFSALGYTYMQSTASALVVLAAVALGALRILWTRQRLPDPAYLAAAGGAAVVGVGTVYLALPRLWDNLMSGFGWITGIGVQRTRLTIAEAKGADWATIGGEFGILHLTAVAGFALVVLSAIRGNRRGDNLLIVWAVLITTATFTQLRFLYYLAVVVALLNAELYTRLVPGLRWARDNLGEASAGKPSRGKKRRGRSGRQGAGRAAKGAAAARDTDADIPWAPQAVAMALLVVAILPGNVIGDEGCRGDVTAWDLADCFSPGEERLWRASTTWLRDHSPPVPVTLDQQYEAPPPGQRFDYPEGTYGVLSWWDYGHQIQFEAQRPPVANPFQQQAPLASRIFTADGEDEAMALLDDYLGDGNQVRYLMIDDAMVSTKFAAITIWAGTFRTYSEGGEAAFRTEGGSETRLPVIGPTVENWFLIDLYWSDASGSEEWRLVNEASIYSWIGHTGVVRNDQFQQSGYNTIIDRRTAADTLEAFGSLNFRSGDLVLPTGQEGRLVWDVRVGSALKTYERVAGATLEGVAEPGQDVTASVDLVAQRSGRTFTYTNNATADATGAFAITVPYSTIDPVPIARGGTDADVVAQGPYRVQAGNATAPVHVPDGAVLDGASVPVTFG